MTYEFERFKTQIGMSLIIECYHYYSNRVSILVKVQKVTYKIVLVSAVLTDVKTCFVVLVYRKIPLIRPPYRSPTEYKPPTYVTH